MTTSTMVRLKLDTYQVWITQQIFTPSGCPIPTIAAIQPGSVYTSRLVQLPRDRYCYSNGTTVHVLNYLLL